MFDFATRRLSKGYPLYRHTFYDCGHILSPSHYTSTVGEKKNRFNLKKYKNNINNIV